MSATPRKIQETTARSNVVPIAPPQAAAQTPPQAPPIASSQAQAPVPPEVPQAPPTGVQRKRQRLLCAATPDTKDFDLLSLQGSVLSSVNLNEQTACVLLFIDKSGVTFIQTPEAIPKGRYTVQLSNESVIKINRGPLSIICAPMDCFTPLATQAPDEELPTALSAYGVDFSLLRAAAQHVSFVATIVEVHEAENALIVATKDGSVLIKVWSSMGGLSAGSSHYFVNIVVRPATGHVLLFLSFDARSASLAFPIDFPAAGYSTVRIDLKVSKTVATLSDLEVLPNGTPVSFSVPLRVIGLSTETVQPSPKKFTSTPPAPKCVQKLTLHSQGCPQTIVLTVWERSQFVNAPAGSLLEITYVVTGFYNGCSLSTVSSSSLRVVGSGAPTTQAARPSPIARVNLLPSGVEDLE